MLPAKPEGSMNEAAESPQAKLMADLAVVGEGIDQIKAENAELKAAMREVARACRSAHAGGWPLALPETADYCDAAIAEAEGRQP